MTKKSLAFDFDKNIKANSEKSYNSELAFTIFFLNQLTYIPRNYIKTIDFENCTLLKSLIDSKKRPLRLGGRTIDESLLVKQ